MIVVADSSPLIVLVKIEHVEVLPQLFERVFVPPEVIDELRSSKRPEMIRAFAAAPPMWLVERTSRLREAIPRLDRGETAAINLALELGAGTLLIDESRGRQAAAERNIEVTGTVGVLERAAAGGLLDLADAFDRLLLTDFWVSKSLLEHRLKLFRARRDLA